MSTASVARKGAFHSHTYRHCTHRLTGNNVSKPGLTTRHKLSGQLLKQRTGDNVHGSKLHKQPKPQIILNMGCNGKSVGRQCTKSYH
eukprot:552618-Amphidinium_carterae.1